MKYFIDTEFIEGFHKPLVGKKRHFIDLISIGIVAEDGRTYYAVSNEFNPKDSDDWVYKNVISNIVLEWVQSYGGDGRNKVLDRIEGTGKYGAVRLMQYEIGKSNKQIAEEILEFVGCWRDQHFYRVGDDVPEIYGYYADYDWVLFCSLFGRMIDLPKGFPMYCKDLKQMLDEKVDKSTLAYYGTDLEGSGAGKNLEGKLKLIKAHIDYPKQTNEHNALDDAKWNFELYKFIKSL